MRNSGIRRHYLTVALAMLVITVVVTVGTYLYVQKTWERLTDERASTVVKSQAMEDLSSSINSLFFRVRGYYAFQIESELEAAYEEIAHVKKAVSHLRSLELNAKESELLDELEAFLIDYEKETLPDALSLVQQNDYEGLRELSLNGSNSTVNHFVSYANKYSDNMDQKLTSTIGETTDVLNGIFLLLFITGAILLSFTSWLIWRVVHHLIRPIEQMKLAADQYQKGQDFTFDPFIRNDEIGELSTSFGGMIQTILSKEEELTAQNEELISQQDELYDKQVKMENALSDARFTKVRLERYNGLNHQLSFSLDKQELADTVMNYYDEQYAIDLGIFWLPKSEISALKGFSQAMFERFKQKQLTYLEIRLEKEPYFVLKREADYEQGVSDAKTFVYDFIAAIKDEFGQPTTFVALSRIGRPYTKEDLHDMHGLLKRIALSVDRIEQYEIVTHERSLNQRILDNINEGIRYVSNKEEADIYNQALVRLLELPSDFSSKLLNREEIEMCFQDKVQDYEDLYAFFQRSLATDAIEVSQTSYTIRGEHAKVVHVYSVPVMMEDEKAGTIFVHRDITREYEIDRLKTELVSTVSHELRTPLSSVLGFTELLLTKEMDQPKRHRYLETIHKEAKRLTNLINDFLDLQRMEAGEQSYHMTTVSLDTIAIEMAERFQLSEGRPISIIDDSTQSEIQADRDKIIQVFTNLLSNSIKFSPDGGDIRVTLTNDAHVVTVSVEDQGIGIPANQVDKMFEKFQRFDNSYSRNIGGTGLGLSICREIIEQHGGKIWIESKELQGTKVNFSLPLKEQMKLESTFSNQPSVLIVEDDSSIALLLGEELQMKGFSVIHRSDVESAFELAKARIPDCVVVDIVLEGSETGWQLIKKMKADVATNHIPIVISSAIEREDALVEEFKVERYMIKPYALHELSETVLSVVHSADGHIHYPLMKFDEK